MTVLSTDHHINALRIAWELMPAIGAPIPDAVWREFSFDLHNENAAFNMHQQLKFHQRLLEEMKDPLLGLKMSRLFPPQAYGMFGLTILCAPDMRSAMRFAQDFSHLAYTLQTLRFHETEGEAILEFTATSVNLPTDLQDFFTDRDLAAAYFAASYTSPHAPKPTRVIIEHDDRGLAGHYEEFFGCPVTFNASKSQLFVSLEDLDRPNPFRNAAAFAACVRECERQIASMAKKSDIVGQVRQELFKRPGYLQDIESSARVLSSSPRPLRPKQVAEGAGFLELQQEVRFEQAQDYLRNPKMAISEIADILGYTEPGNFTAAFKRWSGGDMPRSYRGKLAQGASTRAAPSIR